MVGFRDYTNPNFSEAPKPFDVCSVENLLWETVTGSSRLIFFPAGYIQVIRRYFPAEAAENADESKEIRLTDQQDPRLVQLYLAIAVLFDECKRTKRIVHLKNCNISTGSSKLGLSYPKKVDDSAAITFGDKSL